MVATVNDGHGEFGDHSKKMAMASMVATVNDGDGERGAPCGDRPIILKGPYCDHII